MIAYKVLGEGRIGLFSGVTWPPPGDWLEASAVDPCRAGIHACRIDDLPLWLGLGELWEVELDDVLVEERKLVARRGRLVRRVEAWDEDAARAFVAGCRTRTQEVAGDAPELSAFASDLSGDKPPGAAGFIAARAAELHGGPAAYDAERRIQAEWLLDALGLAPAAG